MLQGDCHETDCVMSNIFGGGFSSSTVDSVVHQMSVFEREHPFGAGGERVYSRWAVVDAGLSGKSIIARLVAGVPTRNIADPVARFCHDAGVCFERREPARRIFDGTVVLCKNRTEISEWKSFFQAADVVFLERFDNGRSFEKRVIGKRVWVVSKTVFQKMGVYPSRLVCSWFGMTDAFARFTWVLGFSPNERNTLRFLPDKTTWIRPIVVSHRIHQLFKIPDVLFKSFTIPKRHSALDFSCSVCFEENVDRRLQLECRHRICFSCLFGCVSTGHFLCPVCRSTMDRTFVTEECDDVDNLDDLKNYDRVAVDLLKSRDQMEKWLVFQKTSQTEIGSGLFNFLYKNENVFHASSAATHFPDVDLCSIDAAVLSEEHGLSAQLFESFLSQSLSTQRTKPLVIHCLFFEPSFFIEINNYVDRFFSK